MKAALRWILVLYVMLLGCEELLSGTKYTYLVGVVLFVSFLLALVFQKIRIQFSSVGVLMVILAMLAISSTLWSVDPDRSLFYSVMLAQLLLTTWITTSCIEEPSDVALLAWILVLASVFPSLSMVKNFLTHGAQTQALAAYGDRLSFGGADPNLNAYRFVVSVLAAIHLALVSQTLKVKILLFAVAGLLIASSLLTGSRGGAMALVLSTMILLLVNARRRKVLVLLTTTGLAVLILLAMPYLPASVSERYLGIGTEVSTGTMANRKIIYREGAVSFRQRPLLGVGYLAFESESRQHGGLGYAAHNDPLQIALDLGLIGLVVYLLLIAAILHQAATTPTPWTGLALGLFTAYGVASLSITLLGAKLPWIAFGIILGASGLKKRSANSTEVPWNQFHARDSSTHG